MIRELDRQAPGLLGSVRIRFGACPAGCGSGLPTAVIYRSSRRSVTFRCDCCGLLWAMTVHQMAKSARVGATSAEAAGSEYADGERCIADLLTSWADQIDDKRGRPRRGS